MDTLAHLLTHFSLQVGVFYTGQLCGVHDFERDSVRGHLHLVRRGRVRLVGVQPEVLDITEPTLIFLPRPDSHRLLADNRAGADVVCGHVQLGAGGRNPITDSLPDLVQVRLRELPGVDSLLDLMFAEAFTALPGRQAVLDRLCEVLIVRLLRHCLGAGLCTAGALAGLADARLAPVLMALQAQPARAWTLPDMAALAHLSRARFALRFREVTGSTPADYLTGWRLMLAQRLLARGTGLQQVAHTVGYGSASAFSRSFVRHIGMPPQAWVRAQGQTREPASNETIGAPGETSGGPAALGTA